MMPIAPAHHCITGRHVLFAMIAFFAAVTSVNAVMIYQAVSTFGGLEPDAYRTGLAYNQRIADEAAQAQLGWTSQIAFDDATGVLSVVLKDHDGVSINDLNVSAHVGRPATSVFDQSVELTSIGDGRYEFALPHLAQGTWTLDISARRHSNPQEPVVFQSRSRIWKQS